MTPSIKDEFEKAFIEHYDQYEEADYLPVAVFGAIWMAEKCADLINYQALEEKWISIPSHAKNNSQAIDKLIGAIIRERVEKIRQLAKDLNDPQI